MKNKLAKKMLAGLTAGGFLLAASAQAGSFTLNFNSAMNGTILDTNGVGTGFTARMSGTGAAITGNDPDLLLNASSGVLQMHTSPGADFNGQVAMDTASVVGINLSSLGFNGGNDFTVTANFINLTNLVLQPDQLCLVVGTDSTTGVRAGFINFSTFHTTGTDANEGFGTLTSGGSDAYERYYGTTVGGSMTVVISRVGGVWSVKVNGIDRMPNSSADGTGTPEPPSVVGLDSATDLFVGVVALDVGNDSPWNVNLDTFTVSVSGNSAPTIASQPQKQIVNQGNPASFSVTADDSTKAPIGYQWYQNGGLLSNQTNSTLNFYNVTNANAGGYTVILTNSLGSITSSVAPLFVVQPTGTFALDFNSAASGILDTNGVGTGFPTRLPGTGAALLTDDENLFLDTVNGVLDITTTSSDYNGGNGMDVNESLGVALSTLGFNGSQDLNATAFFPQPFPGTASYDQFGVFVGPDTNYLTRAGSITFANKERFSENIQPDVNGVPANGGGQYFGFAFDSTIPMTVLISRTAGVWHYYIDTVPWDVLTQPLFNGATNLTAGVFAEDVVNGIHKTFSVDSFEARVFNSPTLNITASGGNQTITWNVVGPVVLQSTTNLLNPSNWTTVSGSPTSPWVTPLPAAGQKFYRLAL